MKKYCFYDVFRKVDAEKFMIEGSYQAIFKITFYKTIDFKIYVAKIIEVIEEANNAHIDFVYSDAGDKVYVLIKDKGWEKGTLKVKKVYITEKEVKLIRILLGLSSSRERERERIRVR